jgi:hypothetical protein
MDSELTGMGVLGVAKITKRILMGVAAIILTFAIVQTIASERVEVVELTTTDEGGQASTTRLWIVDLDGVEYLRAGADNTGWLLRLEESAEIRVRRGERVFEYEAVPRPGKRQLVNDLMLEKYTWGDSFFATFFGSRDGSVPVELRPIAGRVETD